MGPMDFMLGNPNTQCHKHIIYMCVYKMLVEKYLGLDLEQRVGPLLHSRFRFSSLT